eukprot:COSAG01_NODE_5565_length_4179_cov_28.199392_2_plen_48_part_00
MLKKLCELRPYSATLAETKELCCDYLTDSDHSLVVRCVQTRQRRTAG